MCSHNVLPRFIKEKTIYLAIHIFIYYTAPNALAAHHNSLQRLAAILKMKKLKLVAQHNYKKQV